MNVSVDDISNAYKKYRLIFDRKITAEDFADIAYKDIAIENKMVTITVENNFDPQVFEPLAPIFTDSVTLSLEEVFLNEMEDSKYDITSIFSE